MEEWERLLNEVRSEFTLREQELDLLHHIDLQLLAPEQAHEEIFAFIINRVHRLLHASHTTVLLRRSTFLEPTYSSLKSVVGQRVPISQSLTGMCLESGTLINVPDLLTSPLKDKYAPLRGYRGAKMRSLMATPIRIRGIVVGVLNVESRTPNAFKPVHERVATAISAQIAIALQSSQVLEASTLLSDVDRTLLSDDTEDDDAISVALENVMSALKRLERVQHSAAQILFLRGEDELEVVHSTDPLEIGLTVDVGESVSGRAIRTGQTVNIGDVSRDPEYRSLFGESIRSEIAVPILFGEDEDKVAIGVINVESEEAEAFYGFYQVTLESFAEKVKTLLSFAKLRQDVTEALESRTADDLLAAVGDQTSHVIHRLNNTVGAMRLRIIELQEMQRDGRLESDNFLEESLGALLDLAERTLKMPDEVIQKLDREGATVDVNQCVKEAIKTIDIPSAIRLHVNYGEDIPALPLYSFNIVVQNLVQNAIDAMPTGGYLSVSTSVVIHQSARTGYFQLVVKDNGQGMPIDIQRKVFELNFTTKAQRGQGLGLGLGLWWVRNFVRRARGDITIRSTPGKGTEVTVKIPVDRADIGETVGKLDTAI
jgi:signal transduction histidine kinase